MFRKTLTLTGIAFLGGALLTACPDQQKAKSAPTSTPKTEPEGAASQPSSARYDKGLSPEDREQVDDDGVVRRGVKLSDAEVMSVSEVFAKAEALNGQSVKVTGTVDKVCQKSGCWFVLAEGDDAIRITSKGYEYFVPSNAPGMKATIEGELEVKTLAKKEAQHLAEDEAEATGEPVKEVEGGQKEIRIASVGLEMKKG